MNQTHGKCVSSITKPEKFWEIIKLYLDKPQTVNKRLAGSVPLSYFKLNDEMSINRLMDLRTNLKNESEINGDFVINCLKQYDIDAVKCPAAFLEDIVNNPNRNGSTLIGNSVIILRRLLPKNKKLYSASNELVLLSR